MPITDYKVTDIERDAVRMEGKADPLNGTLAQNQAEFDEYPELVRDNLDGLCDYLATMSISYGSSAAAATANKGAMTGFVPLGAIIELSMTNGNTSANPTLSIDGVTHTITGMPTVAQVQANSTQIYRLVKTGATALTYTTVPDYIIEYGTRASGFKYKYYASGFGNIDGDTYTPTITSSVGTITSSSSACSWSKIGKRVFVDVRILINTAGTGTGYLKVTMPSTAIHTVGCGGVLNEGFSTFGYIDSATNGGILFIGKYDSTSTIANGNSIYTQVSYTIS